MTDLENAATAYHAAVRAAAQSQVLLQLTTARLAQSTEVGDTTYLTVQNVENARLAVEKTGEYLNACTKDLLVAALAFPEVM